MDASLLVAALALAQFNPHAAERYADDHLIVRVRPGVHAAGNGFVDAPALNQALTRLGARGVKPAYLGGQTFRYPELAARHGLDRFYRIDFAPGAATEQVVRDLGAFDQFEVVERDGLGGIADGSDSAGDPTILQSWGIRNISQQIGSYGAGTYDADADVQAAWRLQTQAPGLVLAIIDSGVNPTPELNVRPGWNTVANNSNVSDLCGHGTHVAGIAGGIGMNGLGSAGVCWGVEILPVRVLDFCWGTQSTCAAGVVWATDHGADVANMSLQYYGEALSFFTAAAAYATEAGVLLVAASGNTAGSLAIPARFPEVMAVGALNFNDLRASFSNFGTGLDLMAPGVDVYSVMGGSNFAFMSGTSMASPHVAGTACLLMGWNPKLTASQARGHLTQTARDLGAPGWDPQYGHGALNTYAALIASTHCWADFNHDGILNLADFGAFQAAFALRSDRANCNGDLTANDEPVIDVSDLACFQQKFAAGCQ